ncbi:hypothetical protein NQ314_011378 [Rhamnusium bicolor]|uniref:Uncharacterized protein n=1 Tax=Rhamnusium bicolor TaxID=1586634 RepID=A0AAV8XJF3_9CUCU|nr:hypothetical protein NQ314_011378 [Rhamnusium bicolor]
MREEGQIEPDILTLLGKTTELNEDKSEDINEEFAPIWRQILQRRLDSETTTKLIKKYPPSENLSLAAAPRLNPEVVSVMNEQHRQRDQRLSSLQHQLGAAITAVGKVLTVILENRGEAINPELVEFLSHAGRLFCDIHHEDSRCRRTLVSSSIDKNFRATLTDVSVDGWLFGSNLGERVKAARDLEKLSSDLKPKVTAKANMSLNAKGLSRVAFKGYRGRPQTPRQQSYRGRGPRVDFRRMSRQARPPQQPKTFRQSQPKQ